MKFRTEIGNKKEHHQINYDSKIMFLGSCFAENIGQKFEYYKFQNCINPFGILFHPKAVEKIITHAINEYDYKNTDVFLFNEKWNSFDTHSSLSSTSQEALISRLNANIDLTFKTLQHTSHLVITLGTAWVYRWIETDKIVANCHKIPQKKFLKELLSVDEISESLEAVVALVRSINKNVKFIFTVSPIRHLKDGYTENSRSKAHLISAVHQIIEPRNGSYYYPSYEVMMDDLRDYRFYKSDLLHPNELAIDYIWNHFKNTWIDDKSIDLMKEIANINKGLSHKPFDKHSVKYAKFKTGLDQKITEIEKKNPQIKFK